MLGHLSAIIAFMAVVLSYKEAISKNWDSFEVTVIILLAVIIWSLANIENQVLRKK